MLYVNQLEKRNRDAVISLLKISEHDDLSIMNALNSKLVDAIPAMLESVDCISLIIGDENSRLSKKRLLNCIIDDIQYLDSITTAMIMRQYREILS